MNLRFTLQVVLFLGWTLDLIGIWQSYPTSGSLCHISVPALFPDPAPTCSCYVPALTVWPYHGWLCLRSMFSSHLMTCPCPSSLSSQSSPKRTLLHPGPTKARAFHKEYSSEARCLQSERSHFDGRRSCGEGPQCTSSPVITLASLCHSFHPHALQPQIHGHLGLGIQTSPELCCRCVLFPVVLMDRLLSLHILWTDLGTSSVIPALTLLHLGLLLDPATTVCLFAFRSWIAVRFHHESDH